MALGNFLGFALVFVETPEGQGCDMNEKKKVGEDRWMMTWWKKMEQGW